MPGSKGGKGIDIRGTEMAQPTTPPVPPPPNQPPSGDHPADDAALPSSAASRPVREWIVVGAGIAAVIGSFLPWAKISAPILGTVSMSGVDGSDGWITAGLGLLLVLYGGVSLRGQKMPVPQPVFAALAVVGALGLLGVGVWKIVDLQATETSMREQMSGEDDVLGFGKAMSAATQVSVGTGLWLLTFAGLVGSIAMALTLVSRYRRSDS